MYWNKKSDHNPMGVALGDLKMMLEAFVKGGMLRSQHTTQNRCGGQNSKI
jgi:hypothetical protein